jgi:Zn-dependent metalloprotease
MLHGKHLFLCLFFAFPWVLLPVAGEDAPASAAPDSQAPDPDLSALEPPGPEPPAAATVVPDLAARLDRLGLGEGAELALQEVAADPDGTRHVRLQQRYRGLRVWGGQIILHLGPAGAEGPATDALVRGIRLETRPNLGPAEALAITHQSELPQGAYTRPPKAELVVYPATALQRAGEGQNARDFAPRVTRTHLAWHVHLELENGAPETRHDDFLVDAHTGAVLKRWSTLFTLRPARASRDRGRGLPATTVGRSQYSGEVRLGTLAADCGYVMSDPTRRFISTRDLGGGVFGRGALYVSRTGQWGDGLNYDPTRGSRSQNGQTAAVDAQYGLQTTWDFYRNILGRNGIDGKGRPAFNLVHYASGYDNAFWSDDCFCMTYGDGDIYKTLTALDVVGHEVTHGLCHATADLDYDGESGGLNEANSDIFGVMVHLYGTVARGEGSELPDQGAVWNIGADLATPTFPTPLRYLFKPSLDGFSPDAWTPDLDTLDVHLSSGPMNRAFYFLSQGASARPKDDTHSKYLPRGMTGIGNGKALRIWWRALSTYLTPRSRYLDARHATLRAAADLYGRTSPEVKAVRLAFHGINVDEVNSINY